MKKLSSRVWEYSLNNPEGFTLSLENFEPITSGICVAYEATQDCHGLESLEFVIRHALEHHKIVGGWLNEENRKYYFDSIRLFADKERAEAIDFGRRNKQIAIFDLTNKEEIMINQ